MLGRKSAPLWVFKVKTVLGSTLGCKLILVCKKKAIFEHVRDKLEGRLAGWAEQFLSQAGKEVLVKAVAMALPNFAMSCFKLSIGVCKDLEKAIRNFWWRGSDKRNGVHWISWDRLMKQKQNGGMGFRELQCFNLALLAKLGWRIIQNPESLLSLVLKEKYFPGSHLMEASRGRNTSWGWKGIYEACQVLRCGLRWRVGDGSSINIRNDPWFPKPSTFKVTPLASLQATMVSDLIEPSTRTWKAEMVKSGFNLDDVSPILSIPVSRTGRRDRLVWHHSVNGEYSVRTGYGEAVKLMENGALGRRGRGTSSENRKPNQVWNLIWKLKVPNKIKLFIWRCCNNSLVVRHNLKKRDVDFLASWEKFCKRIKGRDKGDELLQEFVVGLWCLWKNRNDCVFKGSCRSPVDIVDMWKDNIWQIREALTTEQVGGSLHRSVSMQVAARAMERWSKPRFGFLKVNTDAAWCKLSLRMGVGWVCRDFAGILQAAGGSGSGFCHSAAAAEACAIRDALVACLAHGFDKIIFESDAKAIVQMLRKEVPTDFSLECILGDIEVLARGFTCVSFDFVSRECNYAAHSVAKYVLKEGRDFVWDCIGPDFLFNILAKDVNISLRF